MTSKGNTWLNFIKKPLKNGFIHDSSEVYAFPQILSLTDTSSPEFSPMDPQFLDLVPSPL